MTAIFDEELLDDGTLDEELLDEYELSDDELLSISSPTAKVAKTINCSSAVVPPETVTATSPELAGARRTVIIGLPLLLNDLPS